ncbi:MAG: hypothetical protein ACOY46_19635 [Bacillota bacterium]
MTIEPEIEKVLDEHNERIQQHEEQITQLRIDTGKMEQRLNNIESAIQETKSLTLQGNALILNTLQNIISEMTKLSSKVLDIQSGKDTNKTNIYLKLLAIIGTPMAAIGSYFIGKSH